MAKQIEIVIPLEEFERLHREIDRHVARVAELENELLKAYSERDAMEVELHGVMWGLSNANAEEHDIRGS